MSLPDPVPGLVIRHAFLWSHEAARGPITHSPPDDDSACVEVPALITRDLGLDDDRQWLRFDELNSFDWPGFDLVPLPGNPSRFDYGMLPRSFFETARRAILSRIRAGKRTSALNRDE